MVAWLTSDYGLSAAGAAHLLGQVVRYEVGNVFNPAYTMICSVEKKWLPKLTCKPITWKCRSTGFMSGPLIGTMS